MSISTTEKQKSEYIKNIERRQARVSEIVKANSMKTFGRSDATITEIRLEAKIISVADTYDALTSNRVYRSGLNKEAACSILQMGKNTFYDPQIVDIFLGGIGHE
jgi:hypothetical protein